MNHSFSSSYFHLHKTLDILGLSVIDAGRTILSSNYAAYHNYDFGSNTERTDVSHSIEIYGYYTGSYDYYVEWTRTGEGAYLLDLDVATY